MSHSSNLSVLDQQSDLTTLIADVSLAIGEALRESVSFSSFPLLYRDLRISLAPLVAEIKSIETLQALAQLHVLQQSLGKVAKALNGILRSDYLKAHYQRLEEVKKTTRRLGFLPLWFTGNTEAYQKEVDKWANIPYPYLRMLRDLSQSPLWQELKAKKMKELLSDDRQLITHLVKAVKDWNALVDRAYAGESIENEEDLTDKRRPEILVNAAAFHGKASVRNLSQELYNILHENWPCRFEEHDHSGRLGHCVGAKFCLDPQWSSGDLHPSHSSFYVLLIGPDIIQECRVCLNTTR